MDESRSEDELSDLDSELLRDMIKGRESADTNDLLQDSSNLSEDLTLVGDDQDETNRVDTQLSESFSESKEPMEVIQQSQQQSSSANVRASLESSKEVVPESPTSPTNHQLMIDKVAFTVDDEVETADLAHLEPKLRDAWIKMRKLDKVLMRVCQQERQVKRETLVLMERNRAELELLRVTSDHKESKVEAENTAHFLALSYVDLDDEMDDAAPWNNSERSNNEPSTPVFKTQLPDMDEDEAPPEPVKKINNSGQKERKLSQTKSLWSQAESATSKQSSKQSKESKQNNSQQNTKNKDGKDFIKRNIQLAQDAGGTLAMTEEEKKRLNDLLVDLEGLDATSADEENKENIVAYNPFAVSLMHGEGFTPERHELERLKSIDSALEVRGNVSRIRSNASSALFHNSTTSQTTIDSEAYRGLQHPPRQITLNDEFDENEFGDKFIREARISREHELRLKLINAELERMKAVATQSTSDVSNRSDDFADSALKENSVVSIIDQRQLKELLEEFSQENSVSGFNQKLDSLQEEDLETVPSDYQSSHQLGLAKVRLEKNTRQLLLEQAHSEGIVLPPPTESDPNETSYLTEFLKVLEAKRCLNETCPRGLMDESSDEASNENHFLKNIRSLSPSPTGSPDIEENVQRSEYFPLQRESMPTNSLDGKLLPLLVTRKTEEINDGRVSACSSSSVVLPKLESRHLPKYSD